MSMFKELGARYKRSILVAALVGGTVAAGIAYYRCQNKQTGNTNIPTEKSKQRIQKRAEDVPKTAKSEVSAESKGKKSSPDRSMHIPTEQASAAPPSPPLSLDSPTSIEIISMSESMGQESLMASSDFVHLDELSSSNSNMSASQVGRSVEQKYRTKDENDIVVIEDRKPGEPITPPLIQPGHPQGNIEPLSHAAAAVQAQAYSVAPETTTTPTKPQHTGGTLTPPHVLTQRKPSAESTSSVEIPTQEELAAATAGNGGGASSKGSSSDIEVIDNDHEEGSEENEDFHPQTDQPQSPPTTTQEPEIRAEQSSSVEAGAPASPDQQSHGDDASSDQHQPDLDLTPTQDAAPPTPPAAEASDSMTSGDDTLTSQHDDDEQAAAAQQTTETPHDTSIVTSSIKITHPKDPETLLSFGAKLSTHADESSQDQYLVHRISSVTANSSAANIGLEADDELIRLNGMSVQHWTHPILLEQLRVIPAEEFELTIKKSTGTKNVKVHLEAQGEGVSVSSELFDVSGSSDASHADTLPVIGYDSTLENQQCRLKHTISKTNPEGEGEEEQLYVHITEQGLQMSTIAEHTPNFVCEAVTYKLSGSEDKAVILKGRTGVDVTYVTAVGYTQLALQRCVEGDDITALHHTDPRVFYVRSLDEHITVLESSQLPGTYLATDGNSVYLKPTDSVDACKQDQQTHFTLQYTEQ